MEDTEVLHGDEMVATAPLRRLWMSLQSASTLKLSSGSSKNNYRCSPLHVAARTQLSRHFFRLESHHRRTQNSQDCNIFCDLLEYKENYVHGLTENSWFCKEGLRDLRPRKKSGMWYTTLTPVLKKQEAGGPL